MVTVTLADLAYRYRQFLIAVVGAGVVMAMALLLAGLVGGFSSRSSRPWGGGCRPLGAHRRRPPGGSQSVGVFPQSDAAMIARHRG